ncbi:MAG: cation transporter [Clostridia bacterium]|nr:cation transporter [Clostridia bacterium]
MEFLTSLSLPWLLTVYVIAAAFMTFFSIKAANYVDWLDKKTTLSGAFIGGIMLSAITSLPELFTSLSSTVFQHQPQLALGNILGSDLFNIAALATLILLWAKSFSKANIAKGHFIVTLTVIAAYVTVALSWLGIIPDWNVSLTSIVILVLYGLSIKYLAGEESETSEDADDIKLSVKQIVFRLVCVSIGIVAFSIVVSYMTEHVAEKLHLGQGFAGALFMGVATSLPELSSTTVLFKKRNYDIAVGNIVGSNIFNFTILSLVDVMAFTQSVYNFADPKNVLLILLGILSSLALVVILKTKKTAPKVISSVAILLSYLAFLALPDNALSWIPFLQ